MLRTSHTQPRCLRCGPARAGAEAPHPTRQRVPLPARQPPRNGDSYRPPPAGTELRRFLHRPAHTGVPPGRAAPLRPLAPPAPSRGTAAPAARQTGTETAPAGRRPRAGGRRAARGGAERAHLRAGGAQAAARPGPRQPPPPSPPLPAAASRRATRHFRAPPPPTLTQSAAGNRRAPTTPRKRAIPLPHRGGGRERFHFASARRRSPGPARPGPAAPACRSAAPGRLGWVPEG